MSCSRLPSRHRCAGSAYPWPGILDGLLSEPQIAKASFVVSVGLHRFFIRFVSKGEDIQDDFAFAISRGGDFNDQPRLGAVSTLRRDSQSGSGPSRSIVAMSCQRWCPGAPQPAIPTMCLPPRVLPAVET